MSNSSADIQEWGLERRLRSWDYLLLFQMTKVLFPAQPEAYNYLDLYFQEPWLPLLASEYACIQDAYSDADTSIYVNEK